MTRDADEGFFSRWSRRKSEVREQQKTQAPQTPQTPQSAQDTPVEPASLGGSVPSSAAISGDVSRPRQDNGVPVANADDDRAQPTLQEAESLTPASDFSRFVKKDVSSDVRNAAVKKLFADPHFNVMDGLDIYIDDYSQTEPIPAAMMAKMVGAQFLKLVDDPADTVRAEVVSGSAAPHPADDNVLPELARDNDSESQSDNKTEVPAPEAEQPIAKTHESHDNPDLQLQPNHSAGRQGAG